MHKISAWHKSGSHYTHSEFKVYAIARKDLCRCSFSEFGPNIWVLYRNILMPVYFMLYEYLSISCVTLKCRGSHLGRLSLNEENLVQQKYWDTLIE